MELNIIRLWMHTVAVCLRGGPNGLVVGVNQDALFL